MYKAHLQVLGIYFYFIYDTFMRVSPDSDCVIFSQNNIFSQNQNKSNLMHFAALFHCITFDTTNINSAILAPGMRDIITGTCITALDHKR